MNIAINISEMRSDPPKSLYHQDLSQTLSQNTSLNYVIGYLKVLIPVWIKKIEFNSLDIGLDIKIEIQKYYTKLNYKAVI